MAPGAWALVPGVNFQPSGSRWPWRAFSFKIEPPPSGPPRHRKITMSVQGSGPWQCTSACNVEQGGDVHTAQQVSLVTVQALPSSHSHSHTSTHTYIRTTHTYINNHYLHPKQNRSPQHTLKTAIRLILLLSISTPTAKWSRLSAEWPMPIL